MKKEWFSASELAAEALPLISKSKVKIERSLKLYRSEICLARVRAGCDYLEYSYRCLPFDARAVIVERYSETLIPCPHPTNAAWIRFKSLPEVQQNEAFRRFQIITFFSDLANLRCDGESVRFVCNRYKISASSLYRWLDQLRGVSRPDFLPYLECRSKQKRLVPLNRLEAENLNVFSKKYLLPVWVLEKDLMALGFLAVSAVIWVPVLIRWVW